MIKLKFNLMNVFNYMKKTGSKFEFQKLGRFVEYMIKPCLSGRQEVQGKKKWINNTNLKNHANFNNHINNI